MRVGSRFVTGRIPDQTQSEYDNENNCWLQNPSDRKETIRERNHHLEEAAAIRNAIVLWKIREGQGGESICGRRSDAREGCREVKLQSLHGSHAQEQRGMNLQRGPGGLTLCKDN